MKFYLGLLSAFLVAVPLGAEPFVCACDPQPGGGAAKPTVDSRGSLSAMVIFAKFRGEASGDNEAPFWADDLFNENLPGSFAHFYQEASRGQLRLDGATLAKRYSSLQPASAYVAEDAGTLGNFGQFNLEILRQADPDVDMGLFDNDGPDGRPNSGDDDGYVDILFINLLTVPERFFIDRASGLASLGLDTDFISDDPAANGGQIRIRSKFTGFGGTTQRGHVYNFTSASMTHEFGHVLGLPDLFDQSANTFDEEGRTVFDPVLDSAGIGKWGLMGLGTLGWNEDNGPNAFCAWSLEQLGWIGLDNANLVTVTQSMRDVVIEDIDQGGRVYKIPLNEDEYFLLENRQPSGSYYDRNIPAGGLLVWHVDMRADNDEERHKQVDLICADGLYTDRGFPGNRADPVNGGDNLDFWSRDDLYASATNGNKGDATDPFDGERFTRLAYDTNPGFSAHTGFSRNLPLGFALENIRRDGTRMIVDILLRQPLAGHISADTTWSGTVDLASDIVVEKGATLTLAAGTQIRFALQDNGFSGFDTRRVELLVFGQLNIAGTQANPVHLRSAASRPRGRDWSGLFLLSGQAPDLTHIVVDHALNGVVRSHLPPGQTRWSQDQRIPFDLVVPANAELIVEAGTRLGFTSGDMGRSGRSPTYTELIVKGSMDIEGQAGSPVLLTLAAARADSIWYGVRLREGARFAAQHAHFEQTAFALSGTVPAGARITLEDSQFRRAAGNALNLTVNGQLQVDRGTFEQITGQAINIEGSGQFNLRQTVIQDNRGEGLFLGNCSLEAIELSLLRNGAVSGASQRSGLQAVGGSGQKIELWQSTVDGNGLHGLDLEAWEGQVELHDSQVSNNRGHGLAANGLARLVFEQVVLDRNRDAGAVVVATPVELWTSTFTGNQTGLILRESTSGVIDMGQFSNNPVGLELHQLEQLVVRSSRFERGNLGLLSDSSTPVLQLNQFSRNGTGIRLVGSALPQTLSRNTFRDHVTAIDNQTALPLTARENFWGTTDSTAIAGQIVGDVDWTPFLDAEPQATAVAQAAPSQVSFALHSAAPNPFNAATLLRFSLPQDGPTRLVLYNILGRPVRRLLDNHLSAGEHQRIWDGSDDAGRPLATGVYLYQLRAGAQAATGRLLLLR
ncbi:MAG: T9SS type A sorting domain-containing protein [Candidatus Latescibacteria bacterium]|nr:T9SS type A sorting domain-containing protein [Candidatus Latescibacterota bacterium]